MSKSSKFVSAVLVVMMFLVGTSTALAGPPVNTHEVVNGPIDEWMLPDDGSCEATPDGLTGGGDRHQVINTTTNADGSMVITINDVVRGTAWDGTGTYHYVYTNHSVEEIPAGGGAHQITMVDSFVLNGNGSVGHMNVGFNWRWTYTGDLWPPSDNWERISERGDPLHCDPI